jgi:hypothetical protein
MEVICLHLYMKIPKKDLKCQDIMNIHLLIGKIVHSKDNFKLVPWQHLPNKHSSKLLEGFFSKNHKTKDSIIIITIMTMIMTMTMTMIMKNFEKLHTFINFLFLFIKKS